MQRRHFHLNLDFQKLQQNLHHQTQLLTENHEQLIQLLQIETFLILLLIEIIIGHFEASEICGCASCLSGQIKRPFSKKSLLSFRIEYS
jgi:hypothetical protein